MDDMRGTNQTEAAEGSTPSGQKPKDGRAHTSALNGKLGGRPRGSGIKIVDWRKLERLRLNGGSEQTIATALGISRRTMKRRIADHQTQDDPGW